MAFPQVVTTSAGAGSSTSVSVTLPSGIATGDLLLCFFGKDGTAAATGITGTGWAELANSTGSTNTWGAVYWKIADGSDSLTIEYTSFAEVTNYVCFRIGSWHGTTPPAAASDYNSSVNNAPDPPNLALSGWTGSEDTLWIAAYMWDDASKTHVAYPASYADNRTAQVSGGTGGCGVAVSSRELAAGSENPGAGELSNVETWASFTVAVRPAGGGGGFQASWARQQGRVIGAGVI